MEIDANQLLVNTMKDGIREGIKQRINQSYQNPFNDVIDAALKSQSQPIKDMIGNALTDCLKDQNFVAAIKDAVRSELAKILVKRFGGELEKTVNQLKSDPATRARITLAIEEIIRTKAT